MRILRLRAYYAPEQTAASHLTKDMNNAYCSAGITCVNITPMPTRGVSEEVRKEYRSKKREVSEDGHIIVRRFSMYREGKNPIFRALRYVLSSVAEYCLGVREKDIDLVLGGSTPPTQGMLSALVAKKLSKKYKKHVPFVFELQDLFPESLSGTGLAKKGSFLYRLGDRIAMYTYRNADKIVVISQDFKRILMEKGVPEEKIEVVYNWVDENAVVEIPRENNTLFDEYGLDREKFYVAYSGNIGHTQNMDMLMDVADKLRNREDIGFILVGDGAHRETVEKLVKEKELNNVFLLPFQPYERISEVFSLGDFGLIISKKGVGQNSVPSKTWSYMSAQRPILASFDEDSELCRLIAQNRCGVCVPPDDGEALEKIILEITENKEQFAACGENGRKFILANITKEVCCGKWISALKNVCFNYAEKA